VRAIPGSTSMLRESARDERGSEDGNHGESHGIDS
jgi:hypothetical protein